MLGSRGFTIVESKLFAPRYSTSHQKPFPGACNRATNPPQYSRRISWLHLLLTSGDQVVSFVVRTKNEQTVPTGVSPLRGIYFVIVTLAYF